MPCLWVTLPEVRCRLVRVHVCDFQYSSRHRTRNGLGTRCVPDPAMTTNHTAHKTPTPRLITLTV